MSERIKRAILRNYNSIKEFAEKNDVSYNKVRTIVNESADKINDGDLRLMSKLLKIDIDTLMLPDDIPGTLKAYAAKQRLSPSEILKYQSDYKIWPGPEKYLTMPMLKEIETGKRGITPEEIIVLCAMYGIRDPAYTFGFAPKDPEKDFSGYEDIIMALKILNQLNPDSIKNIRRITMKEMSDNTTPPESPEPEDNPPSAGYLKKRVDTEVFGVEDVG